MICHGLLVGKEKRNGKRAKGAIKANIPNTKLHRQALDARLPGPQTQPQKRLHLAYDLGAISKLPASGEL